MIPARGSLCRAALLCAAACATPPEVKQATVALDDGYRANLELMTQYRKTVESTVQLQRGWARYVNRRLLLSSAVELATMDPTWSDGDLKDALDRLGADVASWINANRLAGLKARGSLLAEGKTKLDDVLQRLPDLVSRIRKKVDEDLGAEVQPGAAPFDEYARRVAVLRNANAAVRAYLGADVTVSAKDVKEISDAIKQLGSSR